MQPGRHRAPRKHRIAAAARAVRRYLAALPAELSILIDQMLNIPTR